MGSRAVERPRDGRREGRDKGREVWGRDGGTMEGESESGREGRGGREEG